MRDGCSPTCPCLCTTCHWHIAHLVTRHDSLPYNVDYVYQLYYFVGPQGFDRCSLLWFSSSKRKGVQTQPCVIERIAMAARTRTKQVVQLEEDKGIEALHAHTCFKRACLVWLSSHLTRLSSRLRSCRVLGTTLMATFPTECSCVARKVKRNVSQVYMLKTNMVLLMHSLSSMVRLDVSRN
jgi:hypothetical protein